MEVGKGRHMVPSRGIRDAAHTRLTAAGPDGGLRLISCRSGGLYPLGRAISRPAGDPGFRNR